MSAFATAFREIVQPVLTKHCTKAAELLAYGEIGWSDAYDPIMQTAIQRGALHLPDAIFRHLEDWLASHLLELADEIEAKIPAATVWPERERP